MTVLAPVLRQRFFDADANPLDGGKLYSYVAGSGGAVLKPTYKDDTTGNANTNPVVLDATGAANIWLDKGSYYFVLKDKNDNLIWDVDDVDAYGFDYSSATAANNIGWTQTGSGAIPTNVGNKLSQFLSPEDFGALGDGATDDTLAMRKFIAALCSTDYQNGALTRGKVYILNPVAADYTNGILIPTRGFTLKGNNACIKIKNGTTGFGSIIGNANAAVDLAGLDVSGVVYNHNALNEAAPFTVTAGVFDQARQTLGVRRGRGISFCNNLIINPASVNCVWLVDNVSDSFVNDNEFIGVGGSPGNTYGDHSTIYALGDNIEITGNIFTGYAYNADYCSGNAVCAIEVHGNKRCIVKDNYISRYHTGINVTGISLEETRNVIISDNTIDTLRHGIVIFSSQYATHLAGYGIVGLIIHDNTIRIHNGSLRGNMTGGQLGVGGIVFNSLITLDVIGVKVHHNTITFDIEGGSYVPDYTGPVVALGVLQTSGAQIYSNVCFDDNEVINPPGIAIMMGDGGGTLNCCSASRNTISNPFLTKLAVNFAFRRAIQVAPYAFVGSFHAEGNVINGASPALLVRPLVLSATVDSTAANIKISVEINWSTLPVSGGDFRLITKYSDFIQPVCLVETSGDTTILGDFGSFTSAILREGSRIYRRDTEKTQVWTKTGTPFILTFYSDNAPTYNGEPDGSIIYRRVLTVNQPQSYIILAGIVYKLTTVGP